MAALLSPTYTVRVVNAIADAMGWKAFEWLVRDLRPKYDVTQLTAPTLQNDSYETHLYRQSRRRADARVWYANASRNAPVVPSLDFGLRGEPDLTLRDVIDHLEGKQLTDIDTKPVVANHLDLGGSRHG